jgi:hypothetical protein
MKLEGLGHKMNICLKAFIVKAVPSVKVLKGLDVLTIFDASNKMKSMILLSSMNLLTNYENPFRDSLQRLFFNYGDAYRKPPVITKNHTESHL